MLVSAGCDRTPAPVASVAPVLIAKDSIRLDQRADAFLELPRSITPDGESYVIADARQAAVFRYDRTGRLLQRVGHEGEGPGEFRSAVDALAVPRGILVVSWDPPAAQLFDRDEGTLLERHDLAGPIESVLIADDSLWLGAVQYGSRTGVRVAALDGIGERRIVPLPDAFQQGGPLGGIFGHVALAVWGDTLAVGFEPVGYVLLAHRNGAVLDTIVIPTRERRGVPSDPESALREAMRLGPYPRVFGVLSAMRSIHRRNDGSLVVVHLDHRPEGPPVTSEAFVTVIAADRRRACVDARIPLTPEAQPAFGFDADDLLVLEQVIQGTSDAVPVLRRYAVDVSNCAWVDL